MTYFTGEGVYEGRLQIAEFTISGTPTQGQYFTMSSANIDNFDSGALPTGGGTNTLNFSAGCYFFRAFFDVTRASANDNCQFKFEFNSTLAGASGQTNVHSNLKYDGAEVPFKSNSSFNLKLKCIAVEGSAPVLTSNSKIYVWRIS
tara:strand:- start:2974 stop:3411 length:438 start_codon:yes stop_codon:yes gene_type:complete